MEKKMKYCKHCGKEIFEAAIVCPYCNQSVEILKKEEPLAQSTAGKVFKVLACIAAIGGVILAFANSRPLEYSSYWDNYYNGDFNFMLFSVWLSGGIVTSAGFYFCGEVIERLYNIQNLLAVTKREESVHSKLNDEEESK